MNNNLEWRRLVINSQILNYYVSENGDIFSLYSNKQLTPRIEKTGYVSYSIQIGKNTKAIRAHRLVALTFIPNPENKPEVNHIDANKQNNHVSNLEWVFHDYNMKHARKLGLIMLPRGEDHHMTKNSEQDIKNVIDLLLKGYTLNEINKMTGVAKNIIQQVQQHRSWTHLTIGLEFQKYNNYKKFEEFGNISSGYIKELIYKGLSNIEIFKESGMKISKKANNRITKLRNVKIKNLKKSIKMLYKNNNDVKNRDIIINAQNMIDSLKRAKAISKNEQYEIEEAIEFLKYKEFDEIFNDNSDMEYLYNLSEKAEFERLKLKFYKNSNS